MIIFLSIFLVNCAQNSKNFDEILIDNGNKLVKINAEIADDKAERERGLMFREKLNDDEGMLFVFDDGQELTFWMKNTLIPLDMIFIDENFQIANIEHAAPCKNDPCALYKSAKPAKYVLEVNENFTTRNNINVGNKIITKSIKTLKNFPSFWRPKNHK